MSGRQPRTRNARRAAIHSLSRYAGLRHLEHAEQIGTVLAIPPMRYDKALVTWLTATGLPPAPRGAQRRAANARDVPVAADHAAIGASQADSSVSAGAEDRVLRELSRA